MIRPLDSNNSLLSFLQDDSRSHRSSIATSSDSSPRAKQQSLHGASSATLGRNAMIVASGTTPRRSAIDDDGLTVKSIFTFLEQDRKIEMAMHREHMTVMTKLIVTVNFSANQSKVSKSSPVVVIRAWSCLVEYKVRHADIDGRCSDGRGM